MAILDIQITASSLRDIQGGLGASVDEGSWISTSYLIAEIVTIPLTGWLSRVFSPRLYIVVNAFLFVVFSIACGTAHDLGTMIVCRAMQGFTGGILIPMCFTVILEMLPPSRQPVGLALFGMSATLAPSIGPVVGGFITDNFGWPFIFYLNVIPGLVLLAMLLYSLPASPMRFDLLKNSDIPGIVSMSVGLSCLIYVLEEGQRKDWLGSESISNCAVVALVFLSFFIFHELRARHPLVNLRLLKRRNFGFGAVANVALGFALYGTVYALPLYLAVVQEYSAWQIGQVLIWSGLPQLFITPFVPALMKRIDARILSGFGLAMFCLSCSMNVFMSHDYAGEQLTISMIIRALGLPFIITPLSALTTAGIEKSETGSASALFNMMRNLGGSVGTAMASTVIIQREQFHSFRIYEHVSLSDPGVRAFIDTLTAQMKHTGATVWSAHNQALAVLSGQVRREAFVMAFNDVFLCFSVALLLGALATVVMKKLGKSARAAGAH